MIPWLEVDTPFPDVSHALTEADGAPGLLAAGADLSPQRLLDAYRHGIFPWFSEHQPVLWWSTDPRMVLPTAEFRISESLRKTLKKVDRSMRAGGPWQVRFDTDFRSVIRACAAPREQSSGTWISGDIIDGYCQLHALGYAHSTELWRDEQLVGGAYGVCIGRMFYGESMFARVTDASKVALAYLVEFLRAREVELIDCQQETDHLASLGARTMARADFISHMKAAIARPAIDHWVPQHLSLHAT
jgi:leucyl/phenylalanyl-tRNA--protein transferase